MEQRKYFRFTEGAERPDPPGTTDTVKHPDGADVVDFLDAVFATKNLSDSILRGLRPSTLKVYANEKAEVPLRRSDKLAASGKSEDDPIIVQLPRVWYELRDADAGASFANTVASSVRLTENDSVETLLKAVYGANGGTLAHTAPNQLVAYESLTCFAKNQPLDMASAIGSCGRLENAPVVVIVPKRGKRQSEGGNIEEAAKRQKMGVNKKNLAFVKPYQSTAARLKDTDEVTQVVEAVATVQQSPEEQIPFIVLESSSGMGKTQMAFNLMARDDIDVFYIVCDVVDVNVQYVYTAFRTRSIVFGQCVSKDTEDKKKMKSGDVSEIEATGELQTYALICALLTGSETMAETATRGEVEETLIAWKKRAPGKQCAIFLDEFPREEPSRIIQFRFMRNVFRSFRLPVILSSTNGTARNLINYGQQSRGRDDKTLWCVVLTKFPRFQDPFLDLLRPDLRLIIEHSRPLFARKA
ncbi:hypothetical protein PHYSODRAFT_294437 [Phytophthora sojae]|uniref:Uncharacterized protein n=1 Tax=Phytophthora sojae (strain P6497) TaxID=1094619 RepID=G4YJ16_PHYSP|nr:hypothetical protein PHYSODRAFT_294437 [Phytophthora sojae]EGZ29156.1 hypothetical protein PHYSODRAFT_294437 [Phytophthora sojae]|eukprot:XP_009516431.1 hypothetical protein PHYSODRAFT_294437 [Phytophthora sojae]